MTGPKVLIDGYQKYHRRQGGGSAVSCLCVELHCVAGLKFWVNSKYLLNRLKLHWLDGWLVGWGEGGGCGAALTQQTHAF